jgi:hypothetical protein
MDKARAEAKNRYAERIREYKHKVDSIRKDAEKLEGTIRERTSGGQDPDELGRINHLRLELASGYLNLVSYYILMNSLSLALLGMKNEAYLNEARKACYKSIIALEEIVTPYIDVPYSEYAERLTSIQDYSDQQRYDLLKKLGYSIDSVIEDFGQNSKWKWSFVELQGRYATITKNLINMKSFVARLDPRIEGYPERVGHMSLSKRLLQQAADRYREKYELLTLRLDDIKQAIRFLAALRRLHLLLGESEESEIVKKKIEIWKAKMEADQKKQEDARRLEKLNRKKD